jgi:hypothetical protein
MKFNRVRRITCLSAVPLLLMVISGTQAQDQHPIMNMLADKIIQKYQTSSCQDLRLKKAEKAPPTPQEQKVIQYLKGDPQLRREFINRIAAPIANKMFDCGLIP